MNRLLEKLNSLNRLKIFQSFIIILITLLVMQLFRITIIHGGKYRYLADSRRVKEVMITAQRGNIRDRNGIVLAGNRPVFTVQLRKDELEKVEQREKNKNFLMLSRFIEEDGVHHLDEFPIILNTFMYKDKNNIQLKDKPIDIIIRKSIETENLNEIINLQYNSEYASHFSYSIGQDLFHELGLDQKESPIFVKKNGNIIDFTYKDELQARSFKESHNLNPDTNPRQDIISLVQKNPSILRQVLNHPIARKLIYEHLSSKGLVDEITFREFGNQYYDKYVIQKTSMMKLSSKITWESKAEKDFYNLFRKYSLKNFLMEKKAKDQSKSNLELALESQKEKKAFEKFIIKKNGKFETLVNADGHESLDILIKELSNNKALENFLSLEDVRSRAQKRLIEDGVNAGISVGNGEYEYTQLKNLKDLFKRYSLKPSDGTEKLFNKMCESKEIDPKLSIYEKRDILNLYDSIEKQGNYAYIPVNFAYEVSDATVAKIEENLPINKGIEISIEPIRSYPLGKSTSHVLGYIGNIAMEKEIKRYIDKLGYDRNTLIGKTGIEEVFEKELKGKNGYRKVSVDSVGNTTDVIEEKNPVPGKDVQLTIDIDLQQKSEEILERSLAEIRGGGTFTSPWGTFNYISSTDKGRPYSQATSGAVVVVDVKSGEVLAMANYPQYDPNLFAKGINPMDWESLKPEHEKDLLAPRPLYNIAMQSAIQPGSIFKMVTSLAALEKGLDPNMKIQDGGFVDIGGHRFGCWLWNQKKQVHGKEDLANALKDSCNYYFYTLALGKEQKTGEDIGVQVGAKDISDMALRFGLGESTGLEINIPQEVKGSRPDPASKAKLLKSLLKNHLDENIENYYIGNEKLTENKKGQIIKKILSTLDGEKEMTRPEAYNFLNSIEINPEAYAKKEKMQFVDVLKYTYIDQARWKIADTMNVTIGQGGNSYTPVQMARYTMALANQGNLYDLHLVNRVTDPLSKKVVHETKVNNNLIELSNPDFYLNVRNGMKLVADSGANKSLFENFPIDVAMKTGSAERSGVNPYTKDTYDSFAWEVAYAPADNPEVAVCVVIFQGGAGSNAGPILQTVLAEYFGLNKEVLEEKLPNETSIEF